MDNIGKKLVAEFMGSMFLVMASVSPIILFSVVMESDPALALLANALAVAFVLFALIEIFGSISGAFFNPAVTFAMLLHKDIYGRHAALYIPVQIAGGIVGIILCHVMFFDEVGYLLAMADKIRGGCQFVAEIIGTFVLVFTILMLCKRQSSKTALIVSLLVGGQILATSSTMFANPQVTIARMFTGTPSGIQPTDAAVFVGMQMAGAILAFVVYWLIFPSKKEESSQ